MRIVPEIKKTSVAGLFRNLGAGRLSNNPYDRLGIVFTLVSILVPFFLRILRPSSLYLQCRESCRILPLKFCNV